MCVRKQWLKYSVKGLTLDCFSVLTPIYWKAPWQGLREHCRAQSSPCWTPLPSWGAARFCSLPSVGFGGIQGERSFGMNRALGLSFRPSSRSLRSLSGPNKLHIITLAFACPVSLLGALAVGTKSMTKKKRGGGIGTHKKRLSQLRLTTCAY